MSTKVRRVIEIDKDNNKILQDYSYLIEPKEVPLYGKFRKKSHFVKTFYNNGDLPTFSKRVYLADFFILAKRLSPELNMIGKLEKDGWKPIQPQELPNILGVSKSSAYRFLKEAKQMNVISDLTIKDEIYMFINPSYAFNGITLNPLLFWLFQECEIFKSKLSFEEQQYMLNLTKGEISLDLEEELFRMNTKGGQDK